MGKTNNSLFHKILVTVLTISLILGNMSVYRSTEYAYADGNESSTAEPWNGESSKTPQQDSQGYYLIATAAELAGFANIVNEEGVVDANAKLTADIDLGSCEWTPIGNENSGYYCGTFDGQGHTVSNLCVSGGDYAGLFGLANGAIISGITVTGSVYGIYAGGILGSAENDSVTISQCRNEADISSGDYSAGGILGYGTAKIEECVNAGKITSDYSAGGIIGAAFAPVSVSFSYNSGESETMKLAERSK